MKNFIIAALFLFISFSSAAQQKPAIDSCYLSSGVAYRFIQGAQFQRSGDSGKTWTNVASKIIYKDEADLNPWFAMMTGRIHFINDSTGFLIGRLDCYQWREPLLRTSDGGETWKVVIDHRYEHEPNILYQVTHEKLMHFSDERNGILLLGISKNGLIIAATNDAGKSWKNNKVSLPEGYYPSEMEFSDALSGEIMLEARDKEQKKLVTRDGGKTWEMK